MAEHPTCTWTGGSGKQYKYFIWELPASLDPNQDGNYIYARRNPQNQWVPIYIGEGDLADRAGPNHHKADCIKRKGATHFHCHLKDEQAARRAEERDLLARYTNAYEPEGCNERAGG
jgi:hypothetical protein